MPITFKKIFIWLCRVSCSTRHLQLQHVGSSSLTKDRTLAPALGAWSLGHWTTREVPVYLFYLFFMNFMIFLCVRIPSWLPRGQPLHLPPSIPSLTFPAMCGRSDADAFREPQLSASGKWGQRPQDQRIQVGGNFLFFFLPPLTEDTGPVCPLSPAEVALGSAPPSSPVKQD